MLTVSSGCKPDSEPRRLAALVDPIADAEGNAAALDLDVWLELSAAPASDLSDSANLPEGPAPSPPPLLTAAQEAFAKRDYEQLYVLVGRAKSPPPQLLALAVRARAVSGQPTLALDALDTLASKDDSAAVTTLRSLRLHADTASLRANRRFRELVRYVPIEVSPTVVEDKARLGPVIEALRAASLPATAGRRWRGKAEEAIIYYTKELPEAEQVARELRDTLSLPPAMLPSKYLKSSRPIVLVLPSETLGAMNPAGRKTRLEDWLGKELVGTSGGATHRFHLKATGFFTWRTKFSGGKLIDRTGRYHLGATSIALSYRYVERRKEGGEPQKVQQGKRSSHRFRLRPDGLQVDKIRLRTAR